MNIVVIGSCTDSSNLAKELNKRLSDSIVARVDLLKNIKQLVLQDMNVNTTENLGTYVGDVEAYDIGKLSADQKQQVLITIESVTNNITTLKKGYVAAPQHLSTFDALTNSLPSGTYSFIKVYSGAIDEAHIAGMKRDNTFISNAIFVVIKSPKNALLPVTVSAKTLEDIKKSAFAFVECDEVKDVMSTDIFQLLFDLTNDKNKPKAEVVVEQPEQPQFVHGAQHAGVVLEMPVNELLADAA